MNHDPDRDSHDDVELSPPHKDQPQASPVYIFQVREWSYREQVRKAYDGASGPWKWD